MYCDRFSSRMHLNSFSEDWNSTTGTPNLVILIGFHRNSSIVRFTRWVEFIDEPLKCVDFMDRVEDISACAGASSRPRSRRTRHLREAHDRTGGVVEAYLGGRSNRLAPGLSGREQRGGVGVLRWSGEEVSTVGGVASRGDAPVRMSGRTKAVELLDAIEGRTGSVSTISTSVSDDDAFFGVVLTSRYVMRPRRTTASNATREDVRSEASPPLRRGARRARGGRATAGRAPRFEAQDAGRE